MKKYVVPSMEILDIRNDAIYTGCSVDMYGLLSSNGGGNGGGNGGSCGHPHDNGACGNHVSGFHCSSNCSPDFS